MSTAIRHASVILTQEMALRPEDQHDIFLREMLPCAAGGLIAIHGNRPAAEAVYALADTIVDASVGE